MQVKVGTVYNKFLTPEECEQLIQIAEETGFEKLPPERYNINQRTNTRLRVEDSTVAEWMWKRLEPLLLPTDQIVDCPETKTRWRAVGLNSHLRFCKYIPPQFFAKHIDEQVFQGELRSFRTAMLYLNTMSEGSGGATRFYSHNGRSLYVDYSYHPLVGDLFAFGQGQLHDGEPVLADTKYILRSEILYRPEV